MLTIKKIVSYLLIFLVLVFTVIAVLGIWEVIDLDYILRKIMSSLIVIFAASAVVLFIFAILIREPDKRDE
ncbi:MAG: hypothetical protein JSV24_01910 [Bacteroidales bacterium]|nr:MAG: hypothetical protein JSV24_01910 [Bacteroidales bacterium]